MQSTSDKVRSWGLTMRWIRRHILPAYAFLAFCYLMLPIAVVILFSFNDP